MLLPFLHNIHYIPGVQFRYVMALVLCKALVLELIHYTLSTPLHSLCAIMAYLFTPGNIIVSSLYCADQDLNIS